MGYLKTIQTGLWVFPLIAAAFTLPYAVYQYHKHGAVSKLRTLVVYSYILYMLIAFFLVCLPLPDRASTVGNTWRDHLNLIPFKQIRLYWNGRAFGIVALKEYLLSMSLWQLLFNILMTVPFGVYMRYYFKMDMKRTVLCSFLLSLFYETSQLTALFGIYPGPYRYADVEDLICNTMGGAAGYYLGAAFVRMLPSRDEIDESLRAEGPKVTGLQRFWAVLFDYVLLALLQIVLLGSVRFLKPDFDGYPIYGEFYNWSFFCVISLAQVLLTKGKTLGHAACRMALVSETGGTASAGQLIKRYAYLLGFTEPPLLLAGWLMNRRVAFAVDLAILGLVFISRVYFIWYFINMVFRKGRPMPHDRLSGTHYIETAIPEK